VPGAATVSALVSWLARSRSVASIALPKVKLASAEPLKDVLTALGMGVAFNQEVADFAGISPQACCIAFVQHAATMKVDEKGTVATGATAIGVAQLSRHITVAFNRPYLLMVRDSTTGEPLMMAWVANPAG